MPPLFQGIICMILSTLFLACFDILAKYLNAYLATSHIIFLYQAALLVLVSPWVFRRGLLHLKSTKLPIHIVRSLFNILAVHCFFKGLNNINMSDAAALASTQPIFLTLIGILFFKEKIATAKVLALLLGFIGSLIVIRPSSFATQTFYHFSIHNKDNWGIGLILLAVVFWSMSSISIKILGKTEKNETQIFYLIFFTMVWSTPIALIQWDYLNFLGLPLPIKPTKIYALSDLNLTWASFYFILIMAICYFIHSFFHFNSLKHDLSLVTPFRYSKLIFSSILGFLVFNETQNLTAFMGYLLIICSGIVLAHHQFMMQSNDKIKREIGCT